MKFFENFIVIVVGNIIRFDIKRLFIILIEIVIIVVEIIFSKKLSSFVFIFEIFVLILLNVVKISFFLNIVIKVIVIRYIVKIIYIFLFLIVIMFLKRKFIKLLLFFKILNRIDVRFRVVIEISVRDIFLNCLNFDLKYLRIIVNLIVEIIVLMVGLKLKRREAVMLIIVVCEREFFICENFLRIRKFFVSEVISVISIFVKKVFCINLY